MTIDENAEIEDMARVICGSRFPGYGARAKWVENNYKNWVNTAELVRAASHAHRILPEVMAENERLNAELLYALKMLLRAKALYDSDVVGNQGFGIEMQECIQALSHQQKDERENCPWKCTTDNEWCLCKQQKDEG